MPDLTARIREQLDAWAHPTAIFEHPEPLTPAQYDDLIARFKAAQTGPGRHDLKVLPPSPFDHMRAALLAVLELHKREHVDGYKGAKGWDHCAHCRDTGWGGPAVDWPCPTVKAIATALGIEASDD